MGQYSELPARYVIPPGTAAPAPFAGRPAAGRPAGPGRPVTSAAAPTAAPTATAAEASPAPTYTGSASTYTGGTRISTPLVMLHGFTQTSQSWDPVIAALSRRRPLVLPDAPGHGGASDVRADLWETAGLLVRTVGRRAFWAGYSMGGRMALHVALAYPKQVERLVLISTTAGIEDPDERSARRAGDERAAARIERYGLEAFVDQWLAQPLFATLSPDAARREERLANTPEGLASSLRLAGVGTQEPLWARLPELAPIPVLLLAGELDHRYCEHAHRMAAEIGDSATVAVIPGAGHACHLEHPREVAAAIDGFCLPSPPAATG